MREESLLAALYANADVGVIVSGGDGTIYHANDVFQRFLGYSAEELRNRRLDDLVMSGRSDQLLLPNNPCNHGGIDKEVCYQTSNGKQMRGKVFQINATSVSDIVDCKLTFVCDVTRDFRDKCLHMGRAAVLEHLYRDDDLHIICESIVSCIESIEEGVYCSILLLDPHRHTLHKAAAPHLPDFFNQAIEGMKIGDGVGSCGTAAFRGERVIVADILNHPYWARAKRLVERTSLRSCWSEPIFSTDGKILGTFALYYTTPREPNDYELELIRSAAELAAFAINHKRAMIALREADRIKNEFISTAAHELRTPIATILGYVELLFEQDGCGAVDKGDCQDYLTEIQHMGERLSTLIDDLLDVSKINNGFSLQMEKKPVHFRPIVECVIRPFAQKSPQHDFKIEEVSILPDLVNCDELRIFQLFENLLGNAVKYSLQGGEIRIKLWSDTRFLHVTVTDHGIGMSQEQLGRAFDKYYRADASQTSAGGLGLGLSIVRHIVERHGGQISLDSRPGEGTCVSFTLALHDDDN